MSNRLFEVSQTPKYLLGTGGGVGNEKLEHPAGMSSDEDLLRLCFGDLKTME